jgi:hypothetical protein
MNTKPFPADEWLDAGAVARMLDVDRGTVYRYKNSGRLPADADVTGHPLWHVSTVEHYRDNIAPSALVARKNRAERLAVRGHAGPAAVAEGTVATCAACGRSIMFRPAESGSEALWLDQKTGRAHRHGPGPFGA